MATEHLSTPRSDLGNADRRSKLGLLTMFRLGLFQMSLGIMSILMLGVLNRVLIDGLAVPAVIAAGAIAMHQFVAPARVWFGQMSDAKPLFGLHRSGYIWLGSIAFTLISYLAVQASWQLGAGIETAGGWAWTGQIAGWTGFLAILLILYGLALSASSTPFAALLVDVSDEEDRSRLVGVVWSMLMVGIVIGAILSGELLQQLEADAPIAALQTSIDRLFSVVPTIVVGLVLLATVGIEKRYSRFATRSTLVDREDKITLGRALRVLTASRQTGLFFTFLLIMTISLFMQEPILEPYGGQVFGMSYAETTRLNAFWGTGTLVGLSSTGFLIVPRLGKQRTAALGCWLVAGCFALIILSGFTENPVLLRGALVVFGVASGFTTTGAISMMLDLTAAETAGTFIGAWGLSQALARAIATVMGGTVLTLGKQLFNHLVLAYGLVFGLQAIGMILAVSFLRRVNVQEFQENSRQAIATVLESELD
ncbi:BCD family MFS transporter [Thermocoleostomius sinensis]|uniref:BCD family MFS transporter n=1 Tax=Thermocoleostomius sinensis A174 TaxID=2016057 RepID=A0A9E8ZEC2_9CYAN|nr:BCD family MFS transporter [Thermocoleostomius sinensis]WAL61588.1 BCD family MFS transporter [Thermocoleostomius sinensis A174]